MPRLRRGVDLTDHDLVELERALTVEQRYALIDNGWSDLAAAAEFAFRHSPKLVETWQARLDREPGWYKAALLMFWDRAVPLLVENPREPDVPAKVDDEGPRPATRPSGGGSGNRGGAPRKEHPGIALHEAARLIRVKPHASDAEIAAAATKKANSYEKLTGDDIAEHRWQGGMKRPQVPLLRQALEDRLVMVKGGGISLRSSSNESWRPLSLLEWAEIPRLEPPPA